MSILFNCTYKCFPLLLFLFQPANIKTIIEKHQGAYRYSAADIQPTLNYRSKRLICRFGPPTQATAELPTVGRVY